VLQSSQSAFSPTIQGGPPATSHSSDAKLDSESDSPAPRRGNGAPRSRWVLTKTDSVVVKGPIDDRLCGRVVV
jgi:hypothetical protein